MTHCRTLLRTIKTLNYIALHRITSQAWHDITSLHMTWHHSVSHDRTSPLLHITSPYINLWCHTALHQTDHIPVHQKLVLDRKCQMLVSNNNYCYPDSIPCCPHIPHHILRTHVIISIILCKHYVNTWYFSIHCFKERFNGIRGNRRHISWAWQLMW